MFSSKYLSILFHPLARELLHSYSEEPYARIKIDLNPIVMIIQHIHKFLNLQNLSKQVHLTLHV